VLIGRSRYAGNYLTAAAWRLWNQIMAQRNVLERQVNDAYQAMTQAEIDMNAAKA